MCRRPETGPPGAGQCVAGGCPVSCPDQQPSYAGTGVQISHWQDRCSLCLACSGYMILDIIAVNVFVNVCVQCMVGLDYWDTIDNFECHFCPYTSSTKFDGRLEKNLPQPENPGKGTRRACSVASVGKCHPLRLGWLVIMCFTACTVGGG